MNDTPSKPRLVFFQYRYDPALPRFLLRHKQDHVKCLAHFFEVTVVSEDCDYARICDLYEPDLVLFEAGVNHPTCQKIRIANANRHPGIPKLGLHNADGFCNARAGFISDMEHLGIETFFAISTTAAEHTPAIANRLFVWPNFIDPEMYHDYGEAKRIPVLFTGNANALYPWRRGILQLLRHTYPTLVCPHPGYEPRRPSMYVMEGERYARTINASLIVPACGTAAKEVVRKHFEIPACKACLVAEKSAGLEAAGFVDMENCVFADEHDILDKLEHLFANPGELERICEAGYRLAHGRHTSKQRDQLLQWYRLNRDLQPHQRIVQDGPFGALRVVERASGLRTRHVGGQGIHLELLRQGDERFAAGDYEAAERAYSRCSSYMPWMPEPRLGVALSRLYRGDAEKARALIDQQVQFILAQYKAADPDPVEWAYYAISLLCLGRPEEAAARAGEFPWLHHPELDRTRWALALLVGVGEPPRLDESPSPRRRPSLHRLPERDLRHWVHHLATVLGANGQTELAGRLLRAAPGQGGFASSTEGLPATAEPCEVDTARQGTRHRDVRRYLRRRLAPAPHLAKLRRLVAAPLHRLETRYGYFLPYHLSDMRTDEFFWKVRQRLRESGVSSALLVGAADGRGTTEAFLAGIRENDGAPKVLLVNGDTGRFRRLERTFAGHSRVRCRRLSRESAEGLSRDLESAIQTLEEEEGTGSIDTVLVDGTSLEPPVGLSGELTPSLCRARVVLLHDIRGVGNHEYYRELLGHPSYALVEQNPGLRNGYAVFMRSAATDGR